MKKTIFIILVAVGLLYLSAPVVTNAEFPEVDPFLGTPLGGISMIVDAVRVAEKCPVSLVTCINQALAWLVEQWLWLLGQVLHLVSWLFDYSLQISIIQFNALADSDFVRNGWGAVRNIANMFFIFILLWIAIQTILGIAQNTRNMIVNVVIAAIFINFSMALTGVVIDAGNALTLIFYNNSKDSDDLVSTRIVNATAMIKASGLVTPGSAASLITTDTTNGEGADDITFSTPGNLAGLGFTKMVTQALFGSIFILITIFIIGVAAILFLKRMIYLVFLLIVSPWPFLNYAYKGNLGSWWPLLVKQVFFAPAFFAMFWISIVVLESAGPETFSKIGTTADYWGAEAVGQFIYFAMAAAFMFGSLVAANKLGAGGEKLAAWGQDKLKGYASAAGAGLGAYAGRNTLGRAGDLTARGSAKLAERKGFAGAIGRLGMRTGDAVAGTGFGVKGGSLKETREAGAKKKEERHKRLGELDSARIEQEAQKLGREEYSDPRRLIAHNTDIHRARAKADTDKNTAIEADMKAEATKQGVNYTTFVRSTAGRAAFRNLDTKYSADERFNHEAVARRTVTQNVRMRLINQAKSGAAARQQSYRSALGTVPVPGLGNVPVKPGFIAPASSFLAASRIERNKITTDTTGKRIGLTKKRIDELEDLINNPATPADRKEDYKNQKYNLEMALENFEQSKKAAEARA